MAQGGNGSSHSCHIRAECVTILDSNVHHIRVAENNAAEGEERAESDDADQFNYEDWTFGLPESNEKAWYPLAADIEIDGNAPLRRGSKVYRGRQKHFENKYRDVIIKMLRKYPTTEEEATRLLDLNHPNIVRVLRTGDHYGAFPEIFVVMEKCAMDLQVYMQQNRTKPFNFEKSFSYSKQLAEGVDFIHENNIVHRDLAPPNILLSLCQKYVKIADFSLSREVPNGANSAPVTTTYVGTEGFKAPETYKGGVNYPYKADIFPLGINIYYIFTKGRHPFGCNPHLRSGNIVSNANRNLSEIPQFLPPNTDRRQLLQNALESMLQHHPEDRPTAGEVLQHPFFKEAKVEVVIKRMESATLSPTTSDEPDARSNQVETVEQSIKILEDELMKQLNEIGFKRAARIVREVEELRGSEKVEDLLILAECELHLNRGRGEKSIQRVKDSISKSGSHSLLDIRKMAEDLYENDLYVRAMILHKISHNLHKRQNVSPNDELRWIEKRVADIGLVAKPLINAGGSSRMIAEIYGYRWMLKLLNEAREVEGGDTELRVLVEASCLSDISYIANDLDEYEESARFAEQGISLMESNLGKNAVNYRRYNGLLLGLIMAYKNSGENSKAEKLLLKATDAMQRRSEWNRESGRRESFQGNKNWLAIIREILSDQ